MVVPIYILGQQNANAESDILNQLHVLQARIENLEAINNRGLSVATELHDDVSYYLKRVFTTRLNSYLWLVDKYVKHEDNFIFLQLINC